MTSFEGFSSNKLSKGYSQLWDCTDLNIIFPTSRVHLNLKSNIHVEFCLKIHFAVFCLISNHFLEKPVFECAFAHPTIIIFGEKQYGSHLCDVQISYGIISNMHVCQLTVSLSMIKNWWKTLSRCNSTSCNIRLRGKHCSEDPYVGIFISNWTNKCKSNIYHCNQSGQIKWMLYKSSIYL